jgi:flagellar assembly protein FliH
MTMSDAAISLVDLFSRESGFVPREYSSPPSIPPSEADDLYGRGLADGQLMAETAFDIERQNLHRLIAAAQAIRAEDNAEIGTLLNSAILQILRNIVGDLPINAQYLERQIMQATDLLTEADQGRSINLHPADFALLKSANLPLPCKSDHTLAAGDIRIECSEGWIEHGPGFALQRLGAALTETTGAA